MNIADGFLIEFEEEMNNTRGILELVPDKLLDWKAHDNLNAIGWVASHIADTLSWAETIVNDTSFDIAPVGGEPHSFEVLAASDEIVNAFDKNRESAKTFIAGASDETLMVPWTLKQGGNDLFTMPRIAVLKVFFINHLVHHRAFLIAYLRMNDISSPGIYG